MVAANDDGYGVGKRRLLYSRFPEEMLSEGCLCRGAEMEALASAAATGEPAAAPAAGPGRIRSGGAFFVGGHIYCSRKGVMSRNY